MPIYEPVKARPYADRIPVSSYESWKNSPLSWDNAYEIDLPLWQVNFESASPLVLHAHYGELVELFGHIAESIEPLPYHDPIHFHWLYAC